VRPLPDACVRPVAILGLRVSARSWKDFQWNSAVPETAWFASAPSGESTPLTVSRLQVYDGMKLRDMEEWSRRHSSLAGIEEVKIGDTICNRNAPRALPRSPWTNPPCQEVHGQHFALRRADGTHASVEPDPRAPAQEARSECAIQVERRRRPRQHRGEGRGEFQLAILIETMRRKATSSAWGRPEVIYRFEDARKLEPIERLLVDCEERFLGVVTKSSPSQGKIAQPGQQRKGRVRIDFSVPARALIGYRDEFLTDTRGNWHHTFSVRRIRGVQRGVPQPLHRVPSWADRTGCAVPMPCLTWSPGAASSLVRVTRSTRE